MERSNRMAEVQFEMVEYAAGTGLYYVASRDNGWVHLKPERDGIPQSADDWTICASKDSVKPVAKRRVGA